jgi:hypothetical protein
MSCRILWIRAPADGALAVYARYEAYLTGCHSLTRLITCDVTTAVGRSLEMEKCYKRLCEYDVSLTCMGSTP